MARKSWLSWLLVFWLGRPWNAGLYFSVARKATLLWPGLPQNPGLERVYQAFPHFPGKPGLAGLVMLLTALLMQGTLPPCLYKRRKNWWTKEPPTTHPPTNALDQRSLKLTVVKRRSMRNALVPARWSQNFPRENLIETIAETSVTRKKVGRR